MGYGTVLWGVLILLSVSSSEQLTEQADQANFGNVVLFKVVAPPGSLRVAIGDGKLGPEITAVDGQSPIAGSIAVGDLVVAVDNILTFKLLAFHVASLLSARNETQRVLYVIPVDAGVARVNSIPIRPSDMTFLRQSFIERPAQPLKMPSLPQILPDFSSLLDPPQPSPPPPMMDFDDGHAVQAQISHSGAMGPISTTCLQDPKVLAMSAIIDKIGMSERVIKGIEEFSQTESFCEIRTNPMYERIITSVLGCDHLWDTVDDCRAMKNQLHDELETYQHRSTVSLVKFSHDAELGAKLPTVFMVPTVTGLIIAVVLWIILIICGYIDCIEKLIMLCSDVRLKQNVALLGTDSNGLSWYEYEYNSLANNAGCNVEEGVRYKGVMAQDLLLHPRFAGAVQLDNDYFRVDYSLIGPCPFS